MESSLWTDNALSSGAPGQGCQAFQEHFESVCVSRNCLLWCTGWNCAGTQSSSLHFFLLLHGKSCCCLHTLAWTRFAALGIFCSGFRMCLFVSFKVYLFISFTSPHPLKIALVPPLSTLTPSFLWKQADCPFNKWAQNLIWNSVSCWMHSIMCRERVKFSSALQWPWLEWAETKMRSKPVRASWEEKH